MYLPIPLKWTHLISHFSYVKTILKKLIFPPLQILAGSTQHLMAMVPLGDGSKFYIEAYEKDPTHIIREDLKWWEDKFFKNGFNITEMTYEMGPFKRNWQIHPHGNGLFSCSTL